MLPLVSECDLAQFLLACCFGKAPQLAVKDVNVWSKVDDTQWKKAFARKRTVTSGYPSAIAAAAMAQLMPESNRSYVGWYLHKRAARPPGSLLRFSSENKVGDL